ncbi:MAG: nucleotidyltransferase family protein [candidate division NC10 bacterium]|jgi:predicted nucleotidyltransferase|nr:nucleotidyltransferase family protein [candidate division NC10 bacterium]
MDATDVTRTLLVHREVLQQFAVRELRLFGSTLRGEAGGASDIDLLVDYDPAARVGLFAFVRLQRRLSELLGRPVDLATPDALHPALRERILREAVRVA